MADRDAREPITHPDHGRQVWIDLRNALMQEIRADEIQVEAIKQRIRAKRRQLRAYEVAAGLGPDDDLEGA